MMPAKTPLRPVQSTNGLFRALGVDAKALPRTRPFYRRLVDVIEAGIGRGAVPAGRFGGDPEHVLVISGAQQGLDLLTRCLVDPGDAVIVDRPGYLGAIQSFRKAGARLVGWDIVRADVDELEELLLRYRPKLIYTNPTHQNPTGVTLSI